MSDIFNPFATAYRRTYRPASNFCSSVVGGTEFNTIAARAVRSCPFGPCPGSLAIAALTRLRTARSCDCLELSLLEGTFYVLPVHPVMTTRRLERRQLTSVYPIRYRLPVDPENLSDLGDGQHLIVGEHRTSHLGKLTQMIVRHQIPTPARTIGSPYPAKRTISTMFRKLRTTKPWWPCCPFRAGNSTRQYR